MSIESMNIKSSADKKRPGGPLEGKPVQGLDKNWYNKFGEKIDDPRKNKPPENQLGGEESLEAMKEAQSKEDQRKLREVRERLEKYGISKDEEYAQKFWDAERAKVKIGKNPDKYLKDLRDAMMENIEKAVATGNIDVFAGPKELAESEKQKISAYRALAKEMGYEVGQFKLDKHTHSAEATIKKIEK